MSEAPADLIARYEALPAAQALARALAGYDGTLYVVGGAVRDLLLGRRPRELDLLLDGDLAAVLALIGGARRDHGRFGTASVERDGFLFDLARARRERYARPGALPTVRPATVAEDLIRRDFTVNTFALAINGPRAGELLSDPRAADDLDARRLRILHPRSFADDPTRLLRLARYASRLGFAAEPDTEALAIAAVRAGGLRTISGTRLGNELRLLGAEADPVAALAALAPLGIDAALAPGFGRLDPASARRAFALLPDDGDRVALVLAAAMLTMEPAERDRLLAELAFAGALRDRITAAAARAEPLARRLRAARSPAQVAAAVGDGPTEAVALAGGLGAAEAAGLWLTKLRHVRLEIGGEDLLAAGVPSGPAIGDGLRAALAAKLDGKADGVQAELAAALRELGRDGRGQR